MGSARATGTIIAGRYRLVKRIGEGGMGQVWQAHDASLDEEVALKLISTPSPNAAERFRREVKLARRVVHPRCARVFDLGEQGDEMFLTMELVDGTPLARVMHQRALTLGAVWLVLGDVCGALAAVHAVGVVHRDLKPGNILVDKKGHGVVIDFGVARDLGDVSPALTQGTIGTLDFMAPEQVEHGHNVTPAADIYALGTIMFACATRRLPFVDGNEAARAFARTLESAPSLASVWPSASRTLADVIDRCLAREPTERPALDEIHAVLDAEERVERTHLQQALGRETRVADEALGSIGTDETTLDGAPVRQPADDGAINDVVARANEDVIDRVKDPVNDLENATPFAQGQRTLAVLPFTGDDDIGPLVAEELADALSRVRGLRVVAPHTIGPDVSASDAIRAFGATHVVTGNAVPVAQTLKVEAALFDHTHALLWRDTFRAGADELFGSDGTLARRIAEELRLELEGLPHGEIGHEAAVLYMRARKALRRVAAPGIMETIALLDECLELAPSWAPAVAARAMACARARFVATEEGSAMSAPEAAAAVQRALLLAPDLADTHFAGAILAVEEGNIGEGVDRLRATLDLAPMHALALATLGRIEAELGRVHDAIAHIRQAARIDPSAGGTLSTVARVYALRGRYDEARRLLARARAQCDGIDVWGTVVRLRAWSGGPVDDVADVLERIGDPTDPQRLFTKANARFVASHGAEGHEELRHWLTGAQHVPLAPRLKSFILQLGAEIFARSSPEEALGYLEMSANSALIDVDWIELCPALHALRGDRRFRNAADIVRARAAASWPAERARLELNAP